jgi:bifunctional N-acetylglucosamine-1-phosphate-uridyltransferase/glucosamine-1-phosphate-acetyltransferase GlmU-like protein
MDDVCAVVLAAGKGTRMKKRIPKTLRLLRGKPLIYWSLGLLRRLGFGKVIVITGYGAELVKDFLKKSGFNVTIAKQRKLLGTGYAVKNALNKVPKTSKTVLVLFGDDSALYSEDTIKRFLTYYFEKGKSGTMLVVEKDTPTALGGLKRDKRNKAVGVCTKQEMIDAGITKHEVVCGAYIFEKQWLIRNIKLVKKNPISGEYPLPSLIKIAASKKEFLETFKLPHPDEWQSINTEEELREAEKKSHLLKNWK